MKKFKQYLDKFYTWIDTLGDPDTTGMVVAFMTLICILIFVIYNINHWK